MHKLLAIVTIAVGGIVAAPPAMAQAPAFRVKDINRQPVFSQSIPRDFVSSDGIAFFVSDTVLGSALWRTDGTPSGTLRISPYLGMIDYLTDVDGTLFFIAGKQERAELWKSDGTTAGTVLIREIASPGPFHQDGQFIAANGLLFFALADTPDSFTLWRSDGTSSGTRQIHDRVSLGFRPFNNALLFIGYDDDTGYELWATDGSNSGTMRLKDIHPGAEPSYPTFLTELNGALLFAAFEGQSYNLWSTDGTPAGTRRIYSVEPDRSGGFTVVGNTLFFAGDTTDDGVYTPELWKSDGTEAGTRLVKHLYPSLLANLNGILVFLTGSPEIWTSDGTEAGTVRITTDPGSDQFVDVSMVIGGLLYFRAANSLWRSDGSAAGTFRLTDLPHDLPTPLFTDVGGTLFFFKPFELWRSDGSITGTFRVSMTTSVEAKRGGALDGAFIAPSLDTLDLWGTDGSMRATLRVLNTVANGGNQSSNPSSLTNLGGTLLFTADDGLCGMELWRSDGTEAGTQLVKDMRPGAASSLAANVTPVGDHVFYVADDGSHGAELWRSDGSPGGTTLVKDIVAGEGSSGPEWLTNVRSALFFTASDMPGRRDLWKSDGSAAGTVRVKELSTSRFGTVHSFIDFNGRLAFFVEGELWTSDGSEAGTVPVAQVIAASSYPIVDAMTVFDGALFFLITDRIHVELWKSDGTAAGTRPVRSIQAANGARPFTVLGDRLFFVTYFNITGITRLWSTDGTTEGTETVLDTWVYSADAQNGLLFLSALIDRFRIALWRSDGTAAGSEPIKLITPSTALTAAAGRLLFSSCSSGDCEVWESDGTSAGTRRLADVAAAGSSYPGPFTVARGLAFFSASSEGTEGRELWAVPLNTLGRCGNGSVDPGEPCDSGGESAACNDDCTVPACGDGVANRSAGEECDSWTLPNACCSTSCTALPSGTTCTAADLCQGPGVCDGFGACLPGHRIECDDNNGGTTDRCSMFAGCVHTTTPCLGDCNSDRAVTIDELLIMVNKALTRDGVCFNGDANSDAQITIDEIIAAVGIALTGCAG